jgi:hypothetical protein
MSEPKDLPALSRAELLALVVEWPRQMTELRAEIDQLTRGGKRQAAPFSKGSRVATPKPPGRKPGSGPFHGLRDPDHQRLRNARGWHRDRGNRWRYLDDLRIEPTNHRAQRALRPAVIARTVSPCSKTDRGTHAFEAFTSVVRTLTKQGLDSLVEGLYYLSRSPSIQDVLP